LWGNPVETGVWDCAERMEMTQHRRMKPMGLAERLSRAQLMHSLRQTLMTLFHNRMDKPGQNEIVKKMNSSA